MDVNVQREPGCFFIIINGDESRLDYKVINGVMDIREVFVHERLRGHGMAEKLCDAAFAFAQERGWKVAPSCSYVKEKFLPEHPEHAPIVFEGAVFYKAQKK